MGVLIVHQCKLFMRLKCAHHSVWGQIVFTFIYYNSFPTSPLSVAKESTAVEKCVGQPWSLREAPHISTVISLLIHLIVDMKKCVRHFFVRTYLCTWGPRTVTFNRKCWNYSEGWPAIFCGWRWGALEGLSIFDPTYIILTPFGVERPWSPRWTYVMKRPGRMRLLRLNRP